MNGLVSERYFEYILEELPFADMDNDEMIEALMPWSPSLPERLYK